MALAYISSFFVKPRALNDPPHQNAPRPSSFMTSRALVTRNLTTSSLGVVITGSTRGVGRALAEEFLKQQDGVVVTSRTPQLVDAAVHSLRTRYPSARLFGCVADVKEHADVVRLANFAAEKLGTVNAFICNAAAIGPRMPVLHSDPNDLKEVVLTNLLGPMYCAKEMQRVASTQEAPVHVFIVDGSGTRGNSTAGYVAYGATKRSIPQLVDSLTAEAKNDSTRFHVLSPGMVLTDLLLSGNTEPQARKFFNFLAEEPETVATDLVPRIRAVVEADKSKTYTSFLTMPKAIYQLLTGFLLGFRRAKFFDPDSGERVDARFGRFKANGVRIKEE